MGLAREREERLLGRALAIGKELRED